MRQTILHSDAFAVFLHCQSLSTSAKELSVNEYLLVSTIIHFSNLLTAFIGGLYASMSWWEGVGQTRLLIAPVLVISSFLHHWIPWPRISFTNCSKYYSKVNIDIL
mgnify:CR=1 FL=1